VLGNRIKEIASLFDRGGGSLAELLTQRGDAIVGTLDARVAEVRELLEGQGVSLVEALGERGTAIAHQVGAATEQAMRALDERGTAVAATLAATHEQLKDELSGTIERLHDANDRLRLVSGEATSNLGTVEQGLSLQVDQIQATFIELAEQTGRASEQVAEQVDSLKAVSAGALREAAELVIALDERGRSLSDTTREQLRALADATLTLERIESRMSEALSERREALERVLGEIGERSEILDSTTRSLSASLDDTLRAAENRARQIGAVLTDSAQDAAGAISARFEQIRSTTDEEGQRTAAALRSTYEVVTSDMSEALGNATSRFQEVTNELRGMAQQIQRDLEETRADLRRGVLDLPQETQDTTGEMRRVVADQIKALNELAALVSRSNRTVDAAPPMVARRAEPAPVTELRSVQSAGGGRYADTPAPTPRFVAPAAAPVSRPAEPPPARRESGPGRDAGSGREAAGPGQGGWISNLLARAPRDDGGESEPKPPARPPERTRVSSLDSLDSISGDIARMIDHDAAVELWDRYRRGERNVFSRRLYTIEGQQAFDEIRRKYRREQEFKHTVDRYVDEFERLLAEATREERDPALARSYLTSETGKVYTMLAHASGRFD
jgi:hypothetical protein